MAMVVCTALRTPLVVPSAVVLAGDNASTGRSADAEADQKLDDAAGAYCGKSAAADHIADDNGIDNII